MKPKRLGSPFYIRYFDHAFFSRADPRAYNEPFALEMMGWLEHENNQCIRIVWERFAGSVPKEAKLPSSGLVILKSAILEMRRLEV